MKSKRTSFSVNKNLKIMITLFQYTSWFLHDVNELKAFIIYILCDIAFKAFQIGQF